jgi:hypothetical protein
MGESVEAKALDTNLVVVKVDPQKVTDLILGMDAEVRKCNAIVAEFEGSTLDGAADEDVKRLSQDLSRHYKDADEARKRFKREWQEPQKAVEAAFKDALDPMKELVDAYKGELDARNAAKRQERYELMCEFYEADAPTLAELVPIERFGIERDKMSVAKSWSLVKEQERLHAQLVQALNDWAALKTGHLSFEQEAEAEFFRTLSLQAALNLNAMREEEQAQIDKLNAEMGVAPEPEPTPEQEREPQPEPEQAAAQPSEPVGRYCIVCDMTPAQKHRLLGYMRAAGIHGHINTIRKENANG